MKKIYFLIGYFLMFGFFKAGAFYEFNQEKVNQYLNYSHVQIIANSYQNLESCSNDKDKYNVEFPAYTRSECFKYNQKYSYFICERTYSCNLENINQLANTGIIDSSNTNINNSNNDSKTNNNTNLNNDATNGKYNLTDAEKKKLDAVLNKIKTQGESYNDLTKYNKLLDTFDAKLDTLGNKYSNNKKVTSMVEYLQDGVTALRDNINKKTSSSNGNADDFFCDLLGNCNSNQKENISNNTTGNSSSSSNSSNIDDSINSQKQELAKYFQDLGVTQNIENNLDLLSNTNKAPNKALLDNFADKFNSVENFSKIDALIKRLNNTSNNETINFSKEYLKQKLENIKDKVKNGSEIVQGMYRLSNFKYSGDFLKTHGDVCSLEFGNEWEINKNSIDSVLMTSKTTPVWNTLDKKYNCNNFTNNSLANGGANYFNSKYNNSISCSNKLNVACQKKNNNSSSSNLSNNDSQKQELAKYFQDLGVTQKIENNLDLLSNSNKAPNKALLDNFADKFNSVENFSKIDALIKKLNNTSNNETINFSKEYLKQKLENIKDKVKNGSEIVQGMYRLSNFKYSGDFLKTHGDVCSLEFGNEWEINKNSIDSVLMTSKTTPVWNTLDKKYNCNNFTNNSLANGGANYFNSKNNIGINCSSKLNISCQKKDNSKNSTILNSDNISIKELPSNHISKKLKKITWKELSSIMYNIKNDLNKNISSQSNFGYINNYFAVSTKKYSGRDLINQSSKICPVGYKLANLENGVGKYNLEALGYYMTQNYNIYGLQYDEKTGYKKVSLWSYQNPILYGKLKNVIKNNDKYSNLGLNGFYFEYFSKYGNEKTPRAINKEFYQFYNNNEFISLNKTLPTLCQKNNIADTNKIPGDLNTITTSQYDLTGVSSHKSKGLLAAFNVIEYEYYMSYSKGITYSYYEPILDEKGNYVFYYEVNKK